MATLVKSRNPNPRILGELKFKKCLLQTGDPQVRESPLSPEGNVGSSVTTMRSLGDLERSWALVGVIGRGVGAMLRLRVRMQAGENNALCFAVGTHTSRDRMDISKYVITAMGSARISWLGAKPIPGASHALHLAREPELRTRSFALHLACEPKLRTWSKPNIKIPTVLL
ncbi:hypothetical protein T492DRAFT_841030 [Pavlovales sp. CCMP2436]|nr:hypothetical protein T492DRAFT_841030 [Pavlovales sp. CCMP2436]